MASKQSPLLTNSIAFSINSPGQPSVALLGGRVDKLINEATNKINENSQVLKNTLDKESNIESSIEKQMLIKYVLSWNELALAFQENQMYFESIEAFQTAISIYHKLHMKIHHTFACGDYFLSKINIATKQ